MIKSHYTKPNPCEPLSVPRLIMPRVVSCVDARFQVDFRKTLSLWEPQRNQVATLNQILK